MLIGYARVSRPREDVATQVKLLRKAGCTKVVTEVVPGPQVAKPVLDQLLSSLVPGETLVVCAIDRFARTLRHFTVLVRELESRNIGLVSLKERLDTTTADGRTALDLLSSFVALEHQLLGDRTREGVAAAKARGSKTGRPRALDGDRLAQVKAAFRSRQQSPQEISAAFGISLATLYRSVSGEAEPDDEPGKSSSELSEKR